MQTRFRLLLSDISNLEKFWLKNTTYRAVKISLLCYIYMLQDRTCSEVYDIGDNYIIGYITSSTYDLPGYGTQQTHKLVPPTRPSRFR